MQGASLDRNRLSVLIAALLLGSVLFRFIELPEHAVELHPLGSPLGIRLTGTWVLTALMVGLVCTGTNVILHDHPALGKYPGRPIYVTWILPGIMAGLSAYLLANLEAWPVWVAGLTVVGISMTLVIAAEYMAISPEEPAYPAARLSLNVLAYLLAFVLFAVIQHSRGRSLVTASFTLFAATLLAIDLLSAADVPFRRVMLFSAIVGLILGESTWAINYWQIDSWAGGLLLLLIFYIATNVAHQYLLERLSRSVVVELIVVTLVVIAIILLKA
ncbi:MAG: hypothetical protein N2508_07425 [Anaerolineae bacterium]|nr:hypothetical protein [Anaerolineae bacterium]